MTSVRLLQLLFLIMLSTFLVGASSDERCDVYDADEVLEAALKRYVEKDFKHCLTQPLHSDWKGYKQKPSWGGYSARPDLSGYKEASSEISKFTDFTYNYGKIFGNIRASHAQKKQRVKVAKFIFSYNVGHESKLILQRKRHSKPCTSTMTKPNDSPDQTKPFLHIRKLKVEYDYRGHRIFPKLASFLINTAQKNQILIERIELLASQTETYEFPPHIYYRKLGFKVIGESDVVNKWLDAFEFNRDEKTYRFDHEMFKEGEPEELTKLREGITDGKTQYRTEIGHWPTWFMSLDVQLARKNWIEFA